MDILNFQDAVNKSGQIGGKKHLLLGNGFSIACHPSFKYGTLYEQAKAQGLPAHLIKLLDRYGNNFEDVLKYLDEASFLAKHYGLKKPSKSKMDMKKDYNSLKNILVETIGKCHPDDPSKIADNKFKSCLKFLKNFSDVFTVSYDLLLYWTSVHIEESENEEDFPFRDGFGRDDDPGNPDCSFSYASMEDKPYLFFLHGALHIYTKDGAVWKRVWKTSGTPIIKRVREAFEKKEYPLFVAEGSPEDKMAKIEASSYLSQAFRKFKNTQGHLFIFGHSLGSQDDHILDAICCAEKLKLCHLWVGLYGDPNSSENRKIKQRAKAIELQREKLRTKRMRERGEGSIEVNFFKSETANVWD